MPPAPPSQDDLDRVKAFAHKMGMEAQEAFKDSPWSPLLALAALTTAACNVAVVTDTSFVELMDLVSIHFQAATVAITVQEHELAMGIKLAHSKTPGGPS